MAYPLRMLVVCWILRGLLTNFLLNMVALQINTTVSGSRSCPYELVVKVRPDDVFDAVFEMACFTAAVNVN